MTHSTLMVWEGRWPLVATIDVHARVYQERPRAYLLVLEYPPVAVAGEPGGSFTLVAGRGMSWVDVRRYLRRCGMESGWSPAPPPLDAPTRPVDQPVDAPGTAHRRVIFRPHRSSASPKVRRAASQRLEARRHRRQAARRGQPDFPDAA